MGVGGKRVAGLGGLGGMGERWKIDGRRRGGCGPGMPGPYKGGERKIVGRPALRPPRACIGVG